MVNKSCDYRFVRISIDQRAASYPVQFFATLTCVMLVYPEKFTYCSDFFPSNSFDDTYNRLRELYDCITKHADAAMRTVTEPYTYNPYPLTMGMGMPAYYPPETTLADDPTPPLYTASSSSSGRSGSSGFSDGDAYPYHCPGAGRSGCDTPDPKRTKKTASGKVNNSLRSLAAAAPVPAAAAGPAKCPDREQAVPCASSMGNPCSTGSSMGGMELSEEPGVGPMFILG